MSISDEDLMAYADGELDGAKRADIAQALLTDADLRERLARHQALSELTRIAFEPAPDMSDGLAATLAGLADQPANDRSEKRSMHWIVSAAALFLAGIMFIASLSGPSSDGALITADGDALSAGPVLASVLDASLPMPTTQEIRVERSFISNADTYCRQFRYNAKSPARGLACKTGEHWEIAIITSYEPVPEGSFLPAAGENDPVSLKALSLGIKDILNAEEEAKAARRNWRP